MVDGRVKKLSNFRVLKRVFKEFGFLGLEPTLDGHLRRQWN
jgi:hypothetical protein